MKVSVCVITYNHERFLAQALDGALAQEVEFDFEVVVGEDASTDRTREILAGYAQRHPSSIRVLSTPVNLGGPANFKRTYAACTGEYVALLEGDDYWMSSDKLRKQVEFLDAHPEYTMCGHRVQWVDGANRPVGCYPRTRRCDFTVEALFPRNTLFTSSMVLRAGIADSWPAWFGSSLCGDWPMYLLHAERGPIRLLPEVMGAYRVHEGGLWSSLTVRQRCQHTIHSLEMMREHFGSQLAPLFDDFLALFRFLMALSACYERDWRAARDELRRFLMEPGSAGRVAAVTRLGARLVLEECAWMFGRSGCRSR